MTQAAEKLAANVEASPAVQLDPVAAAGFTLASLWQRHREIDLLTLQAHSKKDDAEHARCQYESDDNYRLIKAHEAIIASTQARSIPGALVQMALIAGLIDTMKGEAEPGSREHADFRHIERLASSIMRVLREHACGVDPLTATYCAP